MVPTKVEHLIIIFFFSFHVLLPATTSGTNTSRGLEISLELVHRDSERSPYYTAGISDHERHERLVKLSKARLQWLKSSWSSVAGNVSLTDIRPPVYQSTGAYLVVMRIGSGAGSKEYMLELDTGSPLTWTQCEPCNPCYPQHAPVFDPRNSPSYRQAPCSDPLCKLRDPRYQCLSNVCTYQLRYADQSSIAGRLSRETFGFLDTSGRGIQGVANLAFGCSNSNHMNPADPLSNGILGMNGDPQSFAVQLAGVTNGIFSYCFPPLGSQPRHSGYLHFGRDIPGTPGMQITPLEIPPEYPNYFVTLLDVSVGGKRLGLDARIFRRHGPKTGVTVDSGAGITHLVQKAFRPAKAALQKYFKENKLSPIDRSHDTCFPAVTGVEKLLPSFTFHFDRANFVVAGAHMFDFDDELHAYCWDIESDEDMTVIGAAQMVNTRFAIDVRQRVMLFAPEDCASNS